MINKKGAIIGLIIMLLCCLYANEVSEEYRLGNDLMAAINTGLDNLMMHPIHFLTPSLDPTDLKNALIGLVPGLFALTVLMQPKKKYRPGIEHGSARWGTARDFAHLTNTKEPDRNIILTESEKLNMDTRKTRLNNNVLVVGGSGSGKTRFFVKPNLMQCHSSYVITDPKGSLLLEEGKMLQQNGYEIKSFNTINFEKSLHYNPLAYIKNEEDILKVVDVLIANTSGKNAQEDFWVKSERLLLTALIAYLWYEAPKEEQTFSMVSYLINQSETREDDEDYENPVDILFKRLESKAPEHFAVMQYKKYKLAAGETAKSILISVGVRLAPFDIAKVRELTSYDEMALDTLGDKKTALFIIIPDTNATFNFLVAMLYTQLFDSLCFKADDVYGGRLPVPVRCILDEFANIGRIPEFDKLIATIRSREISACIILQSISQLKPMYEKSWEVIVDNCDSFLFLGGRGDETTKMVSGQLGKETVDHRSLNKSKGRETSNSEQNTILGRELLTEAELKLLKTDQCVLSVRTCPPFLSKKYDLTKHPRYKQTADFDQSLVYDITKEQSKSLKTASLDLGQLIAPDEKIVEFVLPKSILEANITQEN